MKKNRRFTKKGNKDNSDFMSNMVETRTKWFHYLIRRLLQIGKSFTSDFFPRITNPGQKKRIYGEKM